MGKMYNKIQLMHGYSRAFFCDFDLQNCSYKALNDLHQIKCYGHWKVENKILLFSIKRFWGCYFQFRKSNRNVS